MARLKALLFLMLLALSKGVANVCHDGTFLFSPLRICVLLAFVDKCHLLNAMRAEGMPDVKVQRKEE